MSETYRLNVSRYDAEYLATALGRRVIELSGAKTEEYETYGYGPVVSCDSEETLAHLNGAIGACYASLRQLATQGCESARLLLEPDGSYSLAQQVEQQRLKIAARHAQERRDRWATCINHRYHREGRTCRKCGSQGATP